MIWQDEEGELIFLVSLISINPIEYLNVLIREIRSFSSICIQTQKHNGSATMPRFEHTRQGGIRIDDDYLDICSICSGRERGRERENADQWTSSRIISAFFFFFLDRREQTSWLSRSLTMFIQRIWALIRVIWPKLNRDFEQSYLNQWRRIYCHSPHTLQSVK